jgi:polyisoprenoid-binding protein YceI
MYFAASFLNLKKKYMKKIVLSLTAVVALALVSFSPKPKTNLEQNFSVSAEKSKIDWVGSKTGDYHTGYFPIKSGNIRVDGGKLVGGNFVINVAGLKVTDAAGDRLQGHLSSADFFDISKFGDATFNITSVKYVTDNKVTITGDLTLKGIKAPVTFPAIIRSAERNDKEKGFFAEAFFPFDRTVFGINYGIGAVDTEVQLAIHLYGTKLF